MLALSSASLCAVPTSLSQFFSMYSVGPPIWATVWATCSVGTISIASHGQTFSSYGLDFFPGIRTQSWHPTHLSRSISHQL